MHKVEKINIQKDIKYKIQTFSQLKFNIFLLINQKLLR